MNKDNSIVRADFETGDLSQASFTTTDDYPWTVVKDDDSGSWCAKSASGNHGETSALEIQVTLEADRVLTFSAKVSSERNYEETEGVGIMRMYIGETEVPVTWEENASVEELKTLLPLTIQMSMYGGFEQVGSIGQSITRDDSQVTTSSGDIVLYSGNQIVVFYGPNSWAYTRLGHVDLSAEEMSELLSNGNVEITITLE